ncbi:MAG: MBOAT family protein [Myxococcales bacterium]|nr:MBOAT family protein [Myxococcales bacterium]
MAFNTLSYALFLVVALMVAWGLQRHNSLRLAFLVVASLFFYMCARPWWVLLLITSMVVDYSMGRLMGTTDDTKRRKLYLAGSLTVNLGLLGTFKYYDFFLESIRTGLSAVGLMDPHTAMPFLNAVLPVGISFYTFQTMAYSIDVYRGHQKPVTSFLHFAGFVTFFPQLIAGPITLAQELEPQMRGRPKVTREQISDGVFLIMKGLIKKVAIADWLGLNLVDRLYDNPSLFTSGEVLVALIGYSMQIYGDFSGYSDMAVGSGKLFGYELPQNFDRPYQATTVASFWRRWHMSLSRWVRAYIYFPLGGTRGSTARTYFNLMASLVIMGVWHGANWTFVWYGLIHGCAVGLNRYFNQKRKRLGQKEEPDHGLIGIVWRVACTFAFVTLARILFRAENLTQAWAVTKQLMGSNWTVHQLHSSIFWVLGVSYAIHLAPKSYVDRAQALFRDMPPAGKGVVLAGICGWMVHLSNTQPVPFIYFQF